MGMEGVKLKFVHPSTFICAGPTQSGKSTWVSELITSRNFEPSIEKVVWSYSEYQPLYEKLSRELNIEFCKGLIDVESLDSSTRKLYIIDDLMDESASSVSISNIFTKLSHHRNMSVVLIMQNLFPRGKSSRTLSLNANYMILFKNPRDASQINHLASQMYPGRSDILKSAFSHATSLPNGYLFIDLRQETSDLLRLRTHVLATENKEMIVYTP